jgi:hypothetical protein
VSGWHRADIFRCALAAAAPPRALDQVEGLTIGLMRFKNSPIFVLKVRPSTRGNSIWQSIAE